tara:strand:- start:1348 stop:2139 length:792 start_codon:yes stop_codon:yes gene_type:complete
MIRIIIGFFLFFIVLTFAIWLSVAKIQENYIKDLISNNLEEKYKIIYTLSTTGYPNRLDTSVNNLKLISRDNFELVDIKSFLFMSLIYNKKKYIISIKPPVNIKIGTNSFVITEGLMNASMEKSNGGFFQRLTVHGVKINLKLNNKQFLKIDELILATRPKYSKMKNNNKEFFLKLQKPILHNDYSDEETEFNYKFSLDDFTELELPQLFNQNGFFTKIFNHNYGTIEVNNTNINLENHIPNIPKYFDKLTNSKQLIKNKELK